MPRTTWVNQAGGWVQNPSTEPFEFDGTSFQSPATLHDGWMVYREWYAHGPTLFDWIAENVETGDRHYFKRRRDALAFAKSEAAFVGESES